jgi:hypothetical protein
VKNRFQSSPFKCNLQRYIEEEYVKEPDAGYFQEAMAGSLTRQFRSVISFLKRTVSNLFFSFFFSTL